MSIRPDIVFRILEKVVYLLVEVFNTLFIAGDAVVRSLRSGEDQICDFSSAETNSSRKLYLNIIRLLEAENIYKYIFWGFTYIQGTCF